MRLDGYNFPYISKELGRTVNACIAKLNHSSSSQWTSRGNSREAKQEAAERRITLSGPSIKKEETSRDHLGQGKLPSVTGCRFVVSGENAREYVFCDRKRQLGSSYCKKHHRITHVKSSSTSGQL